MAVKIIEGVPGSGKSYYAVRHIAKTFFKEVDNGYELQKEVTLITNIDSFVPEHISLQDEIKNAGGVANFFSLNFQEKYREDKGQIVYIIDEAQTLFRKGSKGFSEVYSYFEYHRHFGQDIYLVTQNSKKLPPDIVTLVEYVIVAAPRIRSILGEFKYKWISGGEVIKREAFKPSKKVFDLYSSMDLEETEKIKNPVMKTVYTVLFLTLLVGGGAFFWFKSIMAPEIIDQSSAVSVDRGSRVSSMGKIPIADGSLINNLIPEKKSDLVFYVLLNTLKIETNGVTKIKIFWKKTIHNFSTFPHKVFKRGGSWWVVLSGSEFDTIFPDNSDVNYFVLEKDAV